MFKLLSERPLITLFILILLIYCPIFGHLDELPLDCWDESRLAMNAHDMNHSGNWIVTTFWNEPDMWNTKPPLMIWLQVVCIRLFGESELAVRMPSAIAAVATCMLLFWFFVKKYGNAFIGLLACLILITSEGYVCRHGIRSGDYDSLLVFFTTSFTLFWFLYLQESKTKYLYLFTSSLILAALTKGVQPLMFLPAILIYTIYCKKLVSVLKTSHFYISIFFFLFFVVGYYLLREQYNPGYIDAVFKNELGGRFAETIETHDGDFWYYFNSMLKHDFSAWLVLVPIGVLLAAISNNEFIKRFAVSICISASVYLLVISLAATKLYWYDMPAIPLLSILAAIFFDRMIVLIENNTRGKQVTYAVIITMILVFLLPYKIIFDKSMGGENPGDMEDNRRTAEFFQDALRGREDIGGYYVAHKYLEQNIAWYVALLEDKKQIKTCGVEHLNEGYKVIIFQGDAEQYILDNYEAELLGSRNVIKKYAIKNRK